MIVDVSSDSSAKSDRLLSFLRISSKHTVRVTVGSNNHQTVPYKDDDEVSQELLARWQSH